MESLINSPKNFKRPDMEVISFMRNLSPDLAIIPVQIGIRPISGLAGEIDWICGGVLSHLIKNGKVLECDGETLMYSNFKKFPFPLVFVFFDGFQSLSRTIKKVIEDTGAKKIFLNLATLDDIEIEKKDIEIIKFS